MNTDTKVEELEARIVELEELVNLLVNNANIHNVNVVELANAIVSLSNSKKSNYGFGGYTYPVKNGDERTK